MSKQKLVEREEWAKRLQLAARMLSEECPEQLIRFRVVAIFEQPRDTLEWVYDGPASKRIRYGSGIR